MISQTKHLGLTTLHKGVEKIGAEEKMENNISFTE